MLIDCHAHLALPVFDADRDNDRARARAAGVAAVLVVGEDLADDRLVAAVTTRAAATGAAGAALLPCFGLHPDRFAEDRPAPDRAELDATKALIRAAAGSLAAVGEVGLDHYWVKTDERRRAQVAALEDLAALAIELDLPLNVHSRSAGRRALDVLRAAGAPRVLMHAFDGKSAHAARAAAEGFVFSIPPSVVRSAQKQSLVRALPLEALALESDSPVLGPDREARNEPANLVHARDAIAQIQGVSAERVAEVTTANARRLFPRIDEVLAAGPRG
ncbi:MAG: TatD family hydrolase [Polyangiaceae bacterium]|nr:TatD family hydrolase [Polyangiaceae bacterium]